MAGLSYKQEGIEGAYDAIVVDSGIGGLAAAALLARHGRKRVVVLERHYVAGGFTRTFRRPGFEWDVGVHYVGDGAEGGLVRGVFDHLSDGALHCADMGEVYDPRVRGRRRTLRFRPWPCTPSWDEKSENRLARHERFYPLGQHHRETFLARAPDADSTGERYTQYGVAPRRRERGGRRG
jgi:phytoene dehydrogenase-like protein